MKRLANLKFMVMAMFVAMLSMSLTACSDDDDDNFSAIDDYYFEVEVYDKGSLSSENAAAIARNMTSTLSVLSQDGLKIDEAEYYFNRAVEMIVRNYDVEQTFTATFKINMKNSKGQIFKSKLLKLTKDGCAVL
ncbi:MAG: hypothetical protein KHX42_08770 [Prevotella sp.]|nr:hypothetical protein [Prevotella sp.]